MFVQPQDAIVLLFAFLSACQGQTSAMCEAGGLRESVARPESKNSNSLIGLEWHQTMAKYIIKRAPPSDTLHDSDTSAHGDYSGPGSDAYYQKPGI